MNGNGDLTMKPGTGGSKSDIEKSQNEKRILKPGTGSDTQICIQGNRSEFSQTELNSSESLVHKEFNLRSY